jgi:SpoVK/Ycf46/Vps4 family AAA+-type ATPase
LNERILHQINDLEKWINHGQTLLNEWNMKDRIKPGYRVLFYGPPGTGKTLAATLLGKYTGKDVYKIDLSMVVSKFIGETEKNLAQLFAKAENHDWILFFDEADALFGKRTNVRDAHDKYANQEVSYLLQRVETYKGMVILASNFRDNIDEAFVRRFQSIIHFPMPKKEERLIIWQKAFPSQIQFDASLDLDKTAEQYELTGANIVNVVQQVCLQALASGKMVISEYQLKENIQREFAKEGKML